MIERKFDRLPSLDPRSSQYPVTLLWTRPYGCGRIVDAPELRTKIWTDYALLDQGSEGACVGFGISGELAAEPESVLGVDYDMALELYHEAQYIDEWVGESYDGTSVLAGAKVAVNQGYYTNYLWATNESDMAITVSAFGPVVIGVNWHQNMMNIDSNGFLNLGGGIVGGHCVVVIGINVEDDYYIIRNSWGDSWGNRGDAKIRRADMAKLMADDGDVMKPLRVHISPEPENPTPAPTVHCGFWTKLLHFFTIGRWTCD